MELVTAVPKVTTPATAGDFRPISVTPISPNWHSGWLSNTGCFQPYPVPAIRDQFAFCPAGSTTCCCKPFRPRNSDVRNKYLCSLSVCWL